MERIHLFVLTVANILLLGIIISAAQETSATETYTHGPDSERQTGVPQGKVTKYVWESQIFDRTTREYYVYVPAQYKPETPAALMVFQDGHTYVKEDGDFRVPVVFDNLIHKKAMPVTIGLFIDPGHQGSERPDNPFRNSNRSFEYDSLSDQYARFIIEEMIPELSKTYNLADDRNLRAICGLSSGGICAFTVAWQRPDYFHKVLSHIGSFTNIRGGHEYPAMIRKDAKRDIKIFMQDGSNDLDNRFGNWWLSNLQMEAALRFREYEYKFVGGEGEHNGKHGGAILPESLKWLWSDTVNENP
jgi:enterochelin esterase family protein